MSNPAMRIADDSGSSLPRRINFTVAALTQAAPPPGNTRIIIYDAKIPGLAMRVTDKGVKSFTLYRKYQGQPVKMKLGGFPAISIEQARTLAAAANGKMAQGIDPRDERRAVRTSITLQQLFEKYTKEHAELRSTARTRKTDKSRFDTCFSDWTSRKLATIRPENVKDKHSQLAKSRGKITANRTVQLLKRMCNWANINPNPAAEGSVDYFQENERDRFMESGEIPRFFVALEAELNETIRDYIKLSLWTGPHRSNVMSMRWDEINLASAYMDRAGGKEQIGRGDEDPFERSGAGRTGFAEGQRFGFRVPWSWQDRSFGGTERRMEAGTQSRQDRQPLASRPAPDPWQLAGGDRRKPAHHRKVSRTPRSENDVDLCPAGFGSGPRQR